MKIEWNLWIDDTKGLQVRGQSGEEPVIDFYKGEISPDQMAAMNYVVEIARCLLQGRTIDSHFNPTKKLEALIEEEKLVRCQWMKSGKLVMIVEHETKRWKHAETVAEALGKERVFTCTRQVFDACPKRRPATKRKAGDKSCESKTETD
jgi:hypothetical protein